jgi:hypothetical protein
MYKTTNNNLIKMANPLQSVKSPGKLFNESKMEEHKKSSKNVIPRDMIDYGTFSNRKRSA